LLLCQIFKAIVAAETLGALIFDVIERVPEVRNVKLAKGNVSLFN